MLHCINNENHAGRLSAISSSLLPRGKNENKRTGLKRGEPWRDSSESFPCLSCPNFLSCFIHYGPKSPLPPPGLICGTPVGGSIGSSTELPRFQGVPKTRVLGGKTVHCFVPALFYTGRQYFRHCSEDFPTLVVRNCSALLCNLGERGGSRSSQRARQTNCALEPQRNSLKPHHYSFLHP